MAKSRTSDSPLEAASAVGPQLTDAFELLSNETRLTILLALWEAYDPHDADDTVAFSELYDRIGGRDSGNFSYHLDKLAGHFIEETGEGYRLRNAGRKIIQATIAGTGLDERRLQPTEIDMACHRCGAPVELSYESEHLYHICTECEGNTGSSFDKERPVGTLMMFDFEPAGLTDRSAAAVFRAGTVKSLRDFGSLIRGICPECSGPVEESLHVCDSHDAPPGETCPICGTGDEVRVRYACAVCKHGDSYPGHAAIYDHPAVVAFCHEHGIETTFDLDGPAACGELWEHLLERSYTLLSEDPVRLRVSVPSDGELLQLTLDDQLAVIGVERVDRTTDPSAAHRRNRPDSPDDHHETHGSEPAPDVRLPATGTCLQKLRRHRWPQETTCPRCGGTETIRKGTTSKDTQRYRCRDCEGVFNDLTGTIFAGHRLTLPEMFHIVQEADSTTTAGITRQLDRSYKSILNFVHEIDEARNRAEESPALAAARVDSRAGRNEQ